MTDRVEEKEITVTPPAAGTAPVGRNGRQAIGNLAVGIPLPRTFSALKHRNYRLFFTGQFISLIGTWMQNVAQSWLVYDLTGSPFYLGVVSFASSIPALSLAIGAGVIIDRVPKRMVLLITQTGAMLLAFVLSADVFLGWVQPWHIVILSFLLGAVNAFDAPTRQSFVVEMVEDRADLPNAIALNSALFQTGRILGPSLAGILLAAVGAAWCFLFNGISFIAVIIGIALMRTPLYVPAKRQASAFEQLREGLAYIWHTESVRTLMALVSVANLFGFGYSALMPAFAEDILSAGPTGLGLLSASVGVGALTGALLVATLGTFRHKGLLLTFGNLFFPTMVLLFSLSRSFPLSMLILAGVGLGFIIQNATTNTLIQSIVPDHLRGRVMSVYMVVFQGLFPLGSLLAGFIAQRVSIPVGAAFGATIVLLYGLLLLWRAPIIRRLP